MALPALAASVLAFSAPCIPSQDPILPPPALSIQREILMPRDGTDPSGDRRESVRDALLTRDGRWYALGGRLYDLSGSAPRSLYPHIRFLDRLEPSPGADRLLVVRVLSSCTGFSGASLHLMDVAGRLDLGAAVRALDLSASGSLALVALEDRALLVRIRRS